MRRGLKLAFALLVILVGLVVVNKFVTDSETKPAAVSAPGGQIVETSAAELQVVDVPAADPDAAGAPIVLLHGLGGSGRWFDGMIDALSARHRVVVIDLIGHGGSGKPGSGYGIDNQAAAVSETLNELGVQNATIVGHSMGGLVATALAQRSSELADRVVLLGTPSDPGTSELPFGARLTGVPLIGEAAWRIRIDSLIRSTYEASFAPGFDFEAAFEDPGQVIADNRAMTHTSFTEGEAGGDDFLVGQSVASRLSQAGVPLLAILGEDDEMIDPAMAAESYRAVPGADVEVLPGVGHSPNVEAPGAVAKLTDAFAGSVPAVSQGPAGGAGGAGGGQNRPGTRSGGGDR